MRWVVSGTGRLLITLGILILLFVAYQLWGTGIYQARAQDDLQGQFQERVRQFQREAATTTTTTLPGPTTTTIPPPINTDPGDAVGVIRIPKIGVTQYVVEGTAVDDLRDGPGHYVGTPLPGQIGNAGIAGHRTTYGAPFGDLGELKTGDEIFFRTLTGEEWRYVLSEDPFAVNPSQTEVLLPRTQRNALSGVEETLTTLTLTTCHPRYSAAQRLIVNARLEDLKPPAPPPPLPVAATLDLGLSGERESRAPTVIWGLITLAVGLLWWLWFHRHPGWTTWLSGLIPFAVALTVFFFFLERVLPNNY